MNRILAIKGTIKESDIFYITFMIIFIAFFSFNVDVSASADDISYLTALNHSGYFDYFLHRYNTWSGRITVESLAVIIMPHLYFLKVFIVGCYVILSYSVWRLTLADKLQYQYGIPFVITLTLLVNSSVSAEAVYWAAGAFNYLVPVSLGIFSVCVLLNQNSFSAKTKFLCLVALSVSSNSEQCSIILLSVSFLNLTFNSEKRFSQYSLLHYLINIFFSMLLFISPGAHKRFLVESGKFMPNFEDFNFLQKVSFGIDRYVSGVLDKGEFLFVAASFFLILLTLKKSGWIYQAFRASFAMFISCKYNIQSEVIAQPLSPENWFSAFKYLYYGIVISQVSLMLICIIDSDYALKTKRNCVFFLIMGSAITVAIGLSPTVYASGERILYFSEIFLLAFICSLIPEVKTQGLHNPCL